MAGAESGMSGAGIPLQPQPQAPAAAAGPADESSDSEGEHEGPQKLIRKVSTSGQIRSKMGSMRFMMIWTIRFLAFKRLGLKPEFKDKANIHILILYGLPKSSNFLGDEILIAVKMKMNGSVRSRIEDSLLTVFCLLLPGEEWGGEGEWESVPLVFGKLQENREAIEMIEGLLKNMFN
ncbi:hypothetical protein DUI87_16548 [Hirundo rustica rustica]|uniref:Uncharacterized protein n=1 Tax=Hirundo rustica rustica TaxID=333673 RepID=A0A3M0K1H9_HIRRU|nr:hypothetical protein DUI87_16548 [Hirundo rustica rustica]